MRSVLSLASIPPAQNRQWRGQGLSGYAAQSAPVMASRSVSASRAAMEFGAADGKSAMMDTTRGRAHVPAQLGLARARVLYSVLPRRHPPAPGAARRTVPEIKGTGACCRHGQAEVFSSWCISSACGSSVQVSSKDRWRFSTWQKTDNTGGTVAANNAWAQASPGQAGLPPASCVAAYANRPVRQA